MEVHLADMHLAVSEYFDLDRVLSGNKRLGSASFLGSAAFPLVPEDKGTDSRQVYIEIDGTLVGLEMHHKKNPDLSTDDFENADRLRGCGELELIVSSGNSQANEKLMEKVAVMMPNFVQLKPTADFNQRNYDRFMRKVGKTNLDLGFFERYVQILKKLQDVKYLKDEVSRGTLYEILRSSFKKDLKDRFDENRYVLRFLKKVEGIYDGISTELSLVHISSDNDAISGIKGVYLSSKDQEICLCDNKEHPIAFSGFLFSPNLIFYGQSLTKRTFLIAGRCNYSAQFSLIGEKTKLDAEDFCLKDTVGKKKEQAVKLAKLPYDLREQRLIE